ncbi:hypothetical protein LIA77_07335 [Sarocladium implicatum]|nr:hypothetical protein LIA77_07335 [Sarocladium implicatum]
MNTSGEEEGRACSQELYTLPIPQLSSQQGQIPLSSLIGHGFVQAPLSQVPNSWSMKQDTFTAPAFPQAATISQSVSNAWSAQQYALPATSRMPLPTTSSPLDINPTSPQEEEPDVQDQDSDTVMNSDPAKGIKRRRTRLKLRHYPAHRNKSTQSKAAAARRLLEVPDLPEQGARLTLEQRDEFEGVKRAYLEQERHEQQQEQLKIQAKAIEEVKKWQAMQLVKQRFRPGVQPPGIDRIQKVVSDITTRSDPQTRPINDGGFGGSAVQQRSGGGGVVGQAYSQHG